MADDDRKYLTDDERKARRYAKSARPGFGDYLVAGAKDFAQDVKDVIGGTSKGPNFGERKKLMDQDRSTENSDD